MVLLLGDKRTFAAEVGDYGHPPPFPSLSAEAAHQLLAADNDQVDERRERHSILHWGPTTDNLRTYLFRDQQRLLITVQFWRERHLAQHPEHVDAVLVVQIEAAGFIRIFDELATALDRS